MIADLKPYPKYRNAEGNWLGKIPSHWTIRRMKYILHETDSRSTTGKEQLLRVSQYTGVTQRLQEDGMDEPDTRAKSLVNYKRVEPNDLVINIMLAWNGSMGVSRYSGLTSPAYCVYRFGSELHPMYFHHLLRSPIYKSRIKSFSTGVVESRLRLYSDGLYRIEAMLPPFSEQEAIVRYLANATGMLDRAIHAKQKVIALLTEQKQTIINRLVTQGMDNLVPVKPANLPWLGDIPAHWGITSLRRFWKVTDCKHLTVPFVEDGIPLVSVTEVQSFSVNLNRCKRTKSNWYRLLIEGDRKPKRGDLIYCRNVSVGACAIVETDIDIAMGQDVCLIRSRSQNQRYLNYLMHSPFMYHQLELILVGSTFKRINVADIKALTVLIPPRHEQDAICDYLDSALEKYNTRIICIKREIELLLEYRTRLIADVVTGKYDVREAASRLAKNSTISNLERASGMVNDIESIGAEDGI